MTNVITKVTCFQTRFSPSYPALLSLFQIDFKKNVSRNLALMTDLIHLAVKNGQRIFKCPAAASTKKEPALVCLRFHQQDCACPASTPLCVLVSRSIHGARYALLHEQMQCLVLAKMSLESNRTSNMMHKSDAGC